MLESRLTRSKFQEELGYLLADRVLEGAHATPRSSGCCVSREVPLDAAQFDVRLGVAHDASTFGSNVRDPVRRRVGHELARERWPVRVYSVALPLIDDLCPTCRLSCSQRA